MPILYRCVLAAACLAVLGGCSKPYPTWLGAGYGPSVKICGMGEYFAWRPGFESTWSDPTVPYYETKLFTRDVIVERLEERGFTLAPPGTAPDFYIDYRLAMADRQDPFDTFIDYEMSILVLHVIDPVSHQGIWRGWAAMRIPEDAKPKRRREVICKSVDEIMERFHYKPRWVVEDTVVGQGPVEIQPVPETAPAP